MADWLASLGVGADFDGFNEDEESAFETLAGILDMDTAQPVAPISKWVVTDLVSKAKDRLMESFGCIAEAVNYLHSQNIRHKDLKPSQVLLSPKGLWLADFGWSNDMSDFSRSATSGRDRMTVKYQAPERAGGHPCGRAEDIFALGCIFLEMSVWAAEGSPPPSPISPWSEKGWSFQGHLNDIHRILDVRLRSSIQAHSCAFDRLLMQMLSMNPLDRPDIELVLSQLSNPPFRSPSEQTSLNRYFGPCCQRKTARSSLSQQLRIDQHHGHYMGFDTFGDTRRRAGLWDRSSTRISRTGWGCGFCYHFNADWNERFHHITRHFTEESKTVGDWNSSVVIYSLLQRPVILAAWTIILVSIPRKFIGFGWNQASMSAGEQKPYSRQRIVYRNPYDPMESSALISLQDLLERFTPDQDAAALAQLAFDQAVTKVARETDSGPPVPPKDFDINRRQSSQDIMKDTEDLSDLLTPS
ncbi:kinase-like protein [Ophiobolus disseminans]|uniref:Kinase-like protein n=1 Tax=Ophiobolus disseminans TaxID=1469910 RepID=A0A6A7A2S2_9PLEO|nr:kinase-like protein [Ophiobolus disseminans]